jgi:hypothetical protein
MLELSSRDYTQLKEYVDISVKDSQSELEVVFHPENRQKIYSKNDFDRVFERVEVS